MTAIQNGYRRKPLDPRATRLTVSFVVDADVWSIEPVVTNSANYPDHTILLALRQRVTHEGPVVVLPQAADLRHRTLLALRPEDARNLARQLESCADALDRESGGGSIE